MKRLCCLVLTECHDEWVCRSRFLVTLIINISLFTHHLNTRHEERILFVEDYWGIDETFVAGKLNLVEVQWRYKKMIKILFICHGNICRSTMAESVFTYLATQAGLASQFEINSAATSREEIGNPPHYGTVDKLRREHIPLIPHHARQMTAEDYRYYDYLIGMDTANIRNMTRIAGGADKEQKIFKLLTFAGSGRDVADPWYTGDFDATFADVMAGCSGLLEKIRREENI